MDIRIRWQRRIPGQKDQKTKQKLKRVLEDLACHDKELSILFTDDTRMARLNQEYLQRKGSTNVLAFPMTGGPASTLIGDVVISVETAMRESETVGESLEDTIDRLLIHGILHLLGYDHTGSLSEARQMEKEEKRLMAVMRGD